MTNIKLIDENTDLSTLTLHKIDWDVVIKNVPYQVVRIDGYVHSIGGRWGDNDYWCYPLNEEPTVHNLAEFSPYDPVCWGITYAPQLYHRHKWGEHEICRTSGVTITRNGVPFDDSAHSVAMALVNIDEFRSHPLKLDCRGYAEKCIGRKVWWRSEPAVVSSFIAGQACVILEPDGIDQFTVPPEFAKEDREYYADRDVKTHILDEHIWWFRRD